MSQISIFKCTLILIIFLNITIISFVNIIEPGSKAVILATVIILLITLPLVTFTFFQKGKVLAINAAFVSAFIILLEAIFFFKIVQHPAFTTWTISSKNKISVEFLDKQPYVKFKPNVVVRSQGNRGNNFTYDWVTDQFGFKNKNSIEFKVTNFDFIALGDSFTEGMGVSEVDTWTSQVGDISEYQIYNAGVQGYSTSQMKATYKTLENQINHEGILIGLIPGSYLREKQFINKLEGYSKGIGGINIIALGKKGNSFLVQFLRTLKFSLGSWSNFDPMNLNFKKYVAEIPSKFTLAEELLNNQNWIAHSKNLRALANASLEKNKKVVLIMYPLRHEVYFNINELGVKTINEINYYVELNLLRKTLPKEVVFFDMRYYLREYWTSTKEKLYFTDGHMNEKGHELVAKFLVQSLK